VQKLARFKLRLSAIEYRERPFKAFGRLREMGALVPARLPIFGNVWLVTTYEAVNEILKNDKLFCRDPISAGRNNFWVINLMLPGLVRRLSQNMLGKDEPDHRRLRSLVDQAFQRQSTSDFRPRIKELVDQQLDCVEHVAAKNGGEVDLIEHLARPIPLAVICELLGLPAEDRPKFKKWFSSFANIKTILGLVKVVPGLRRTLKYLRGQFEIVRQHPNQGLITALVEAEQAGDRLSDDELQSMVMLLLLAGHETTVHLLSNSILTLLQLPAVKQPLLDDWSKIDLVVEEMLRYNSPAQFSKPRFVTADTELHGQALRRGEVVLPVLSAANYDPAQFENPAEFRIDRPNNHHLGFGAGPHVCLALKLARAETEVTLERLFTRWPHLQPAFDLSNADWSRRIGMRSLNTLVVKCE
jgi:cytochrome P450